MIIVCPRELNAESYEPIGLKRLILLYATTISKVKILSTSEPALYKNK